MNNDFKFATGELSQDAFICWFFNWFNEGDNPKLKQLVCDFCKDKLGVHDLSTVNIHRQYSKKVDDNDVTYAVKIDVLVVLNNSIAIIIEDKTFTSEHSDQINRYKKVLQILQNQDEERKLRIEDNAYNITKIMSVFWKTGFFYDCDLRVNADVIINADDLIELFGEYRENMLIDMYVQKLLDDKKWYEEHSVYWDADNKNRVADKGNTNLCNHQIAQYTLMKEIFPSGEYWKGGDLYYVYHSTSFGRPWTEMSLYCDKRYKDADGDKRFEIFWRIDTDTKGSYISLRLYKHIKGKWDEKYKKIRDYVIGLIEKDASISQYTKNPGDKSRCKEADIAHFTIDKEMWKADGGEHLKSFIRTMTEDVMKFAINYGPNVYRVDQ